MEVITGLEQTIDDETAHNMTLSQAKQLLHNPRSRRVVALASGKVGVCEVGDPNGNPVIWLTGNMGPAMTILLYENIARRHRIRLISIDRPGYNATQFTPGLPLVFEFVDVINEVTLFLGISRFGLAAFSLGAVYAFAFSLWYPERLRGTMHMVSPWLSTSTPGASSKLKSIARYAPNFLIRTTLYTVPTMGQFFYNLWGTIASLGSSNSDKMDLDDKKSNSAAATSAFQIAPGRSYIYNEVYSNALSNIQNGKQGPHNDWTVALEREPWGFSYEETTYPAKVFMGDLDEDVPIGAWRYMSQRMDNVELKIIPGGKHYLLYRMDFMEDLFEMVAKAVREE
ncbi:6100_t:CDS:2 [Paraglomus brasilianum]|uniref:6100_t:CDS:1 n=1 Tax=Paraglomus brasilianum TaxID=144538 RepID=A0A9N9G1F4_9GLOM|nr:6100_t:CDS:2 [Paraglomus brasilianum]